MTEALYPYKKEHPCSHAIGAFVTIELLTARPGQTQAVYVHSAYRDTSGLYKLCHDTGVPVRHNDAAIKRVSQKENTYAIGVLSKYPCAISPDMPHVVLVNPGDMGNLGTIIRTLAGFNIVNLAIITPAADVWHPKCIRASMGALFRLEVEQFKSFEEYRERFGRHRIFTFMLDGETSPAVEKQQDARYSLVFGNEAGGLPNSFRHIGTSIRLPQSELVDSLNLPVAVGIGAYLFANTNGQV